MKRLRIILRYRYLFLVISLLFLLVSFLITKYYRFESKYKISDNVISGYINNINIDGDKLNIEVSGKEKIIATYYFKTKEEKENFTLEYNLGDKVNIKGKLKTPNNNTVFSLFNYKKYLYYNKIYYLMDIEHIELKKKNTNVLFHIKNKIEDRIKNIKKSSSYVNAFVLGNMSQISSEVKSSFQVNGISHLFAISGTNVTFIAIIILKLLDKFKYKHIIIYIFLIFYLFLANFADALFRSTVFFIILSINKILKLNISVIDLLFLSLIICIIFDPFIIYSVGFQFSFIISMYLIIFTKLISRYKSKIATLFIISLISFISSIPIVISNFFQLNFLSIFLNLIYVPYVSLILFPASIITFVFPILDPIMYLLIEVLEISSLFFSKINILIKSFSNISLFIIIIYYIFITIFLYGLYKNIKICLLPLFLLLIVHYNINCFYKYPMITFIDVGQGDSILISFPNSKGNILIDTGGVINIKKDDWASRLSKYSLGKDTIVTYLKSEGIKKLDYLIFSHGDFDHMGEASSILNNFKVDKVIFNCGKFNELEQNLIKILDDKQIKHYSCIKELNIGDNKLHFLNNKLYDNENDNSSVIYTELNNYKFLFMGDAGVKVEDDLIKKYNLKNIDILKVGHHGSKTSSSKEFVGEIEPKHSIISVGKNNRYGHPNNEVLEVLKNSTIYRTDEDGSILIKFKNNKYKITTCVP